MLRRRRRFPRRFRNGGFRRRSRYEISQGQTLIAFTVSQADTETSHATFDLHILSQLGLSRTIGDQLNTLGGQSVISAYQKGISVAWVMVQLDHVATAKVAGTAPLLNLNYCKFGAALYKDKLKFAGGISDELSTVVPANASDFNLFATEVGGVLPASTSGSQIVFMPVRSPVAGAVAEIFGFPDRILSRKFWFKPLFETDTTLSDESFIGAHSIPGQYTKHFLKGKRVTLQDNDALWVRLEGKGAASLAADFTTAMTVSWLVCYKVF